MSSQASSPSSFLVIDDKGGRRYGLKLEEEMKRRNNFQSRTFSFSLTGLTGLSLVSLKIVINLVLYLVCGLEDL